MKILYVFTTAFIIIAVACNKDKFTTIPQIDIKSISPGTVFSGDIITLKGKFTDEEGNLDSVLVVYKWYNGSTVTRNDTFRYSFNSLNLPLKTREGDIEIKFEYNTDNNPDVPNFTGSNSGSSITKDTTVTFGIILRDQDSLRSNYSESAQIRIKKP